MFALGLLAACWPGALHGREVRLGPDVTVCFNVFFDPHLGPSEKGVTVWVEADGSMHDALGRPAIVGRLYQRLGNDPARRLRVNLICEDPARGLLAPACVVGQLLADRTDRRPLVIHLDFLPLANRPAASGPGRVPPTGLLPRLPPLANP